VPEISLHTHKKATKLKVFVALPDAKTSKTLNILTFHTIICQYAHVCTHHASLPNAILCMVYIKRRDFIAFEAWIQGLKKGGVQ
jgi:hypothetical protein